MEPVIAWLMEGDPAIRWQTQRDLLDASERRWKPDQKKTATEGWGAQFLARQDKTGGWGNGLYSPKWTSTTYTLLELHHLGLPRDNAVVQRGARQLAEGLLGGDDDAAFERALAQHDLCVVGMLLELGAYFGGMPERIDPLVDHLLDNQMPDGGWNCRSRKEKGVVHSSLHTTFNVLEGLRTTLECGLKRRRREIEAAEARAREFVLMHHFYRSDHTGRVINPVFTQLSYPYRWHYDLLRGLDYFQRAGAKRDWRAADAIALLESKQRKDGAWSVQHRHSGLRFFDMETGREPSRWNTLRALRVLRWWKA